MTTTLKKNQDVVVDGDVVGAWSNGDGTFRAEVTLGTDEEPRSLTSDSKDGLRNWIQRHVDAEEATAKEQEGTLLVVVRELGGREGERVFLTCRQVGTIIRRELDDKEKSTFVHVSDGGSAPVNKSWCWEQVRKSMDQWNWSVNKHSISISGRRNLFAPGLQPVLEITPDLVPELVNDEG